MRLKRICMELYKSSTESIPTETNTGGSSDYYLVRIDKPQRGGKGYTAECIDIISALHMTWDEANIFKEIWRTANERNGNGKPGNTRKRAYEKILFFAKRLVKHDSE